MRQVWKFPVFELHQGPITGPGLGKIVMFGRQHAGSPLFVWAEIRPEMPDVTKHIFVAGTGPISHITENMEHVSSCLDGSHVWHLYERRT